MGLAIVEGWPPSELWHLDIDEWSLWLAESARLRPDVWKG